MISLRESWRTFRVFLLFFLFWGRGREESEAKRRGCFLLEIESRGFGAGLIFSWGAEIPTNNSLQFETCGHLL